MPIGTPTLVEAVGAAATSATTASFSPAAGDLLLAFAASRVAAGAIPSITDSLGGSWTAVPTSPTENNNIQASLYYIIAAGGARTVTATSASATQVGLAVISISGADIDFSNFQVGTNGAGDPSVTMAAYQASSIAMGFYAGNAGGSNPTLPSGYTSLTNSQIATNIRFAVCYDMSSPSTAQSWTGPSTDSICFGLEIQEAGGGGGTDNLTSQNIANAPSIQTPTIGQTNALTSLGITNAPSIQTASLSQEQALQTQGISISPVIQQPSITQTHGLTALNISNAPFITQPVIETGIAGYIKWRNAIRLARRKAVRVIFHDEMWDDDNPE